MENMGKYSDLLEKEYIENNETDCLKSENKLQFIGRFVFDFTTYDYEADANFASKMIEVLDCILNKRTFEYQGQSYEKYINYLTMCNMPFLQGKLEWGTSIRGAWFEMGDDHRIGDTDIFVEYGELELFFKELIEWSKI